MPSNTNQPKLLISDEYISVPIYCLRIYAENLLKQICAPLSLSHIYIYIYESDILTERCVCVCVCVC